MPIPKLRKKKRKGGAGKPSAWGGGKGGRVLAVRITLAVARRWASLTYAHHESLEKKEGILIMTFL